MQSQLPIILDSYSHLISFYIKKNESFVHWLRLSVLNCVQSKSIEDSVRLFCAQIILLCVILSDLKEHANFIFCLYIVISLILDACNYYVSFYWDITYVVFFKTISAMVINSFIFSKFVCFSSSNIRCAHENPSNKNIM